MHEEIAGHKFRQGLSAKNRGLNLANNLLRVVLPHLVPRGRRLQATVTPRQQGGSWAASAEALEEQINAILPQIRAVDHIRLAVRAMFYSAGLLKVGINARTGIVGDVASAKAPDQAVPIDVDAERAGRQEYLDAELPYVSSVRPTRFYPDPDATSLAECRWVAHEVFGGLEAMREDPRFAEAAREGLIESNCSGPARSYRQAGGQAAGAEDPLLSWVRHFEIFERDRRRVLIYTADSSGNPARAIGELPWPEGIEGMPFVLFVYEPVEDFFWPNPVLSPTFEAMCGAALLVKQAVDSAMAAKNLHVYDPGQVTTDSVISLGNAPPDSLLAVKGFNTQSVQKFEVGGVHPDHLRMGEMLKQIADEMNGISEFHRGIPGASPRPTASEIQASLAMSGVRLDDLKGCVNDGISEVIALVGATYLAHAAVYQGQRLPTGQGASVGLGEGLTGEMIDYAFEVVPASVERVDPAIRQKRTGELLAMSMDPNLAAKLQQEGSAFLTRPLLERHLRELGETHPDEYFSEAGAPAGQDAAAKAQAEDAAMIQGGEPVPVDPADDHQAELAVHQADYEQTGSEAIAMHMVMHQQAMQAMQAGAGPPAAPAAASAPGPMRPPTATPQAAELAAPAGQAAAA